ASVTFGPASADAPRYLTLHASEKADLLNVAHVCNENADIYNGNGCQACKNKGYYGVTPGYENKQMYCTPNAFTNCGANEVCTCSVETPPEDCV
ncbi:MAG: hypothetical protein V1839_03135, partial [archaeon]